MDATVTATAIEESEPGLPRQLAEDLLDIARFLRGLPRELTLRDLRSGLWYAKLLRAYLRYHEANHRPQDVSRMSAAERAELAETRTRRAALITTIAGIAAAGGVTAASVATAQSGGWAGPLVLPLAAAGMVGEMLLRTIVHLQLACDIAEINELHVTTGREFEMIRAYALAVHAEMHQTEDDPGRGLVERVMQLQQAGGLGKLIASNLVGEMLLKNAVPFFDVIFSSLRNWQLTEQVGQFIQSYARRRVRLDIAVEAVDRRNEHCTELVLEGIWFIFITDGRLTGVETALLAHMMRGLDTSDDLTTHFVSDEAGWLERLGKHAVGERDLRVLILNALQVAAEIEGPMTPVKVAILQRAAKTLELEPPTVTTQSPLRSDV
ncbi:MAG TPA: hypothetical protein VJV78_23915 [Polyangiales bacterium]|nr:hypothetical protein [Polyangiales bacterium]